MLWCFKYDAVYNAIGNSVLLESTVRHKNKFPFCFASESPSWYDILEFINHKWPCSFTYIQTLAEMNSL
ncbi:hypothetical protein HanXRQr2_Chr15g0672161 [Helianthus annuus]|uniref:Uncharacterized protein n=1 Tax=Helianthus annuus TaxID=4232 RepID=A0A9K3DWB6_HELAN|nr:hypothetical protein HanXRQr2_Chr15g0672161 [Helianthus annuus]